MEAMSRAMDRQKGSHHFENRLNWRKENVPCFQPHNFILTPNSDLAGLSLKGRCMAACAYECMHLGMDAHCTSIIIEREPLSLSLNAVKLQPGQ